jgi:hypothetical protein
VIDVALSAPATGCEDTPRAVGGCFSRETGHHPTGPAEASFFASGHWQKPGTGCGHGYARSRYEFLWINLANGLDSQGLESSNTMNVFSSSSLKSPVTLPLLATFKTGNRLQVRDAAGQPPYLVVAHGNWRPQQLRRRMEGRGLAVRSQRGPGRQLPLEQV